MPEVFYTQNRLPVNKLRLNLLSQEARYGKYDELVSEAKVVLTDIGMTLHGSDSQCPLKMVQYRENVVKGIQALQTAKPKGLLGKIKDTMFITQEGVSQEEAAKKMTDDLYQLKNCAICKCPRCPLQDENCQCEGCLYGSYVTACDLDTEVRSVDETILTLNGAVIAKTEFIRQNHDFIVTIQDDLNKDIRYLF